jgi:acyl-CoA hydrolase
VAQLDLGVDPGREFERKLVSAHEAAGLVESGNLVWIPSSHQPPAILAALAAREEELRDVTIRSVVIPDMGWFREDAREAWDLQVQYALAPDNRQALEDRLVDFHPLHMINQHKAADTRPGEGRPIDVLMLVVTPPSQQGYVCVGMLFSGFALREIEGCKRWHSRPTTTRTPIWGGSTARPSR